MKQVDNKFGKWEIADVGVDAMKIDGKFVAGDWQLKFGEKAADSPFVPVTVLYDDQPVQDFQLENVIIESDVYDYYGKSRVNCTLTLANKAYLRDLELFLHLQANESNLRGFVIRPLFYKEMLSVKVQNDYKKGTVVDMLVKPTFWCRQDSATEFVLGCSFKEI